MEQGASNKLAQSAGIHQPHDKLIKRLLSNLQMAREVLTLYLPQEVLAVIDLEHLTLEKDSFIDAEHHAYSVDLLYKTTIAGQEAYIWILIEHQRKSEYWMPARLFHYIGIIWEHLRKRSQSKKLPLVYPLVIYNGDKPALT